MTNKPMLHVKPLQEAQILLIDNYWQTAGEAALLAMGVDPGKVPSSEDFCRMLSAQLALPLEQKRGYCVIWYLGDKAVGHSNTNPTTYGKEAFMHLHLWYPEYRGKGYGRQWVRMGVQHFFETLHLEKLYCQPYALNPAPNKVLEKAGFTFVKEYTTVPGSINFEQPVNLWEMSLENYLKSKDYS